MIFQEKERKKGYTFTNYFISVVVSWKQYVTPDILHTIFISDRDPIESTTRTKFIRLLTSGRDITLSRKTTVDTLVDDYRWN